MFLSGESHGQRSLVGYSPWGRKESDKTERLRQHKLFSHIFKRYSNYWEHSWEREEERQRENTGIRLHLILCIQRVWNTALHMTVKVKSLSRVQLFVTPWTVAHQAPPSMGFSRQEYWSGLPFPSPGNLPNSGIEPGSPAFQADALTSEPPGKPCT